MASFDVCVVGSFMKDLVARAARRPHSGETLHGSSFSEYLGGKGFNQAIASARSGARTAIIGMVGTDRYGDEFLRSLDDHAVDVSGVGRHPELGTGVGLPVVEDDGSNSIIIVPRANDAVTSAEVVAAAGIITTSRVISVQFELDSNASLAALRIAAAHGVTTVLNPAPVVPFDPEIAKYVDILVPNEVELDGLLRRRHGDGDLATAAAELADDWDLRACVITLGARGAFVLDRSSGADECTRIPSHEVAAIDTVGAGDAFCGALSASLAQGRPLLEAVRFANAAGALATTRSGASSMPGRVEIEGLVQQNARPTRARMP